MCPKNMLLLKSGEGDQICQICLDLQHLHTNYRNFPPRTPLFFSGASPPRIRLALLGPPTFSLSKRIELPSLIILVVARPWFK